MYDPIADRVTDIWQPDALGPAKPTCTSGRNRKFTPKFGEGKDGRIYFGTHAGLWFDYGRPWAREKG